MRPAGPIAAGVLLAVASATAFGLTIPVLGWAGAGVGAYATAALLYLGASLAALAQKAVVREAGAPVTRGAALPLAVMALCGAAIAPTSLAWGLQRVGPVTGALLLNLEAVWTVVLARVVYREFLGGRVLGALALMTAGGGVLSLSARGGLGWSWLGAAAVAGATFAWAVDNTASRRLAELRPLTVVAAKGALGAALTAGLALATNEPVPAGWRALVLVGAGAMGYGLSLRLYLLAQRRVGAGRTASVFALAPFIGAAAALAMAPAQLDWPTGLAALLFGAGVLLHLAERHAHAHRHDAATHDHAHRHDDGHHAHPHEGPVVGEHSHLHRHEAQEHSHEHGQDAHHGHSH